MMQSGRKLTILMLMIGSFQVMGEEMTKVKTVSEIAGCPGRPLGAPQYSDVCFSPRTRRPHNVDDPHETMRDARAFHATRFDWVYSTDPTWIAECKRLGYGFTGALNTILADTPGVTTRERGRILDKDGSRVAAPWMQNWPAPGYWGCVNSPDYRETFLAHAKLLIDGGIDAIQMDDPDINVAAVAWGGCYCEHCLQKAKEQGRDLNQRDDMLALQRKSVNEFYTLLRKEIDQYAKRRIPWSSNNYDGRSGFPYDLFDYGTAESSHESAKPDAIYRKFAAASRLDRKQIFTFVSTDVSLTRRVIATAYACGGHIIVPCDVYNGDNPRIFGNPEEYADLYGFVRANAARLDGYEDAAAFGKGIEEVRYGANLPVQIETDNVFAFIRAQPGNPGGSVMLHLVDWRDAPEPFILTLRTNRFFGDKPIKVALLVPPPFDNDIHVESEEKGDFSLLSREQHLPTTVDGDFTKISLPPLNPWGIVVLNTK